MGLGPLAFDGEIRAFARDLGQLNREIASISTSVYLVIAGLAQNSSEKVMAYFRKLDPKLAKLQELFNKNERWLILINADPDALASAMALKRILAGRVEQVAIAHVNEITRPDNLAMIRLLRIATKN